MPSSTSSVEPRGRLKRLPALVSKLLTTTTLLFLLYGTLAFQTSYAQHFWQFHGGPGEDQYERLVDQHEQVLKNNYWAAMQYRYLSFAVPEIIRQALDISVSKVHAIWRVEMLWASLVALHYYLRIWFDWRGALTGCLIVVSMYSWFAAQLHFIMATELPEFFFLTISLLSLARGKPGWVVLLAPIGSLFRETTFYILVAWGGTLLAWPLTRMFRKEQRSEVYLLVLTFVLLVAAFVGIRAILGPHEHIGGPAITLPSNVTEPSQYIFTVLALGILWVLPWLRFKSAPAFLRGAALMIPFILAATWIRGKPNETRLFMPLLPVVIPLSLWSLGWQNDSPTEQDISSSSINPT